MRYQPDHKLHAYQHLVEAAARLAKAEGFAATPLRRLTAAAGRSPGALYTLFDHKNDLLRAIVDNELERTLHFLGGEPPPRRHKHAPDTAPPPSLDLPQLQQALAAYLHPAHLLDPAGGCILPTLAAEIARADGKTRRACERGLRRLQAHLARPLGSPAAAWAVLSQAVGAVLIARTMASASASKEVLTSALNDLRQRQLHPPKTGDSLDPAQSPPAAQPRHSRP